MRHFGLKACRGCANIGTRMRAVVYQLFVRHFSNFTEGGVPWGTREENGCGTFEAINDAALESIARMGVTHLWLTGVLRHATQTPHDEVGLPASPACVVKGIAGSPYAVVDYYDVDPDLATEPAHRMQEFEALLQRCRRWGMVPMMDFIPNHVSRCYQSTVKPEASFGSYDNKSSFFARENSFYYMDPQCSDWWLRLPGGEFEPERGHGRVTGNNAATWQPTELDWYETVKLNYGSDYRHGPHAANALPGVLAPHGAVPRTWQLMDDILAYWQGKGVGGFRCDMAHMVPMPFWHWLIAHARLRDSAVFFMAEAYNDHMKLTTGDVHEALRAAGFAGVYDAAAYQGIRSVYEGGSWANDLDHFNAATSCSFGCGVRYIENHDEPRIAHPDYWGGVGERVQRAAMVAQYASSCGPLLIYNGQEVGERAEGPGGFGGDNGRTSIFDYTNLPRFQRWANKGAYDGAGLTAEEHSLREFTARLLPLMQIPALAKGGFYGLNWANHGTPGYGRHEGECVSGHHLYAFLRHYRKAKSTVLVICNLCPVHEVKSRVHLPDHAREWAGRKPGICRFRNLLEPGAPVTEINSGTLDAEGLPVTVPPGGALLLEWEA